MFCRPFQCHASFVDLFLFVSVMVSCLFIVALLSLGGNGLASWLSCMLCFLVFLSFSHYGVLGQAGVVLDVSILIFAFFFTLIFCKRLPADDLEENSLRLFHPKDAER